MSEKLYFVAIIPPEPIFSEIYELKEYLRQNYNTKAALNSPPHITLHMPFKWKESNEEKITEALSQTARQIKNLEIRLSGFAAFPPRVIYVHVENSEELFLLQKNVKDDLRKSLKIFNADYKDRGFTPHVTIAFRDLRKNKFAEAWEEFEKKSYDKKFVADSITLLKHNGKTWDRYVDFNLHA